MANISGNSYTTPVRSQDRDVILDSATITFDANGNPILINPSPGLAMRHIGPGTYTISYKAAPEGRMHVWIAASTTVDVVKGLAWNPTLDVDGATIVFMTIGGVPTDPAMGNLAHLQIHHLPSVAR